MRLLACLLLFWPLLTVAQSGANGPVRYSIAFPNAAHHEARITVVFPQDHADEHDHDQTARPLRVVFARASPGRYALHEFVKNVYDVAVEVGGTSQPPVVRHPDPYTWEVFGAPGKDCRFSYTVFADRADGTYAAIDAERAHLNLPAVLAYAPDLAQVEHQLSFTQLPDTAWRVATQLTSLKAPQPAAQPTKANTYSAPNLQYLMDSPVLLGKLARRPWTQDGQRIEIALLHRGTDAEADTLAARTQRITRAAAAIWGNLPRFDFGQYTFLADYLPTAVGDGMEHRNSTMVPQPKPLKAGDTDHLGTISHEFFHCWNVERLRPADLEPFDFQRANMSSYLWLAEGFTMYYGDLVMRRAALVSDDDYLKDATRLVQQSLLPGAGRFSPIEMSQQAPFVDAARSIDPNNRLNTYVSYYTLGGATALALDLQLRARDHSLDAVMRRLWETNGQFQSAELAPQKPYTLPDIQRAIAEVAGDSAFAGQFVRRHVLGHTPHDWAALLQPAGLALKPANPDKRWLGASGLDFGPTGVSLSGGTVVGSPLHNAGLDRGDRIERLGGRKIRSEKDLTKALAGIKAGTTITADVSQRGLPVQPITLTLTPDPTVQVVRAETITGRTVTEEQKAFRKRWLTGR